MRRFVYLGLIVALLPWIVIGIVRESTDDDTKDAYFVRAIFDNASTLVQGEDVKVAGVPVGVISDLDVTPDKKAAVTLRIDNEGFIPWKADAKCKIGAQGLIGEKFVDCQPGSSRRAAAGDGSARATARASGCCRWSAPARRWTSTCSTTSCGCPTASASRS